MKERINRELIHPERQRLLEHITPFANKMATDFSAGEIPRGIATVRECLDSMFDLEFPNKSIRHQHLGEIAGLGLRTLNTLEELGQIETVADVMAATREELLGLREFGPAQFAELMEALARHTFEQCKRREAMMLGKDR